MRNIGFLFCCLAGLLFSCENKKENMDSSMGKEYFPLQAGRHYIYQIDSIVYDDFNQSVDTFSSRLRIRYVSEFRDSSLSPSLRVEYDNPDKGFNEPGNRWVSVIKASDNRIVHYSDTFRTVKMVFPVRQNKQWNANMFNHLQEHIYTFRNIKKPFSTSLHNFPETVTVVQNELQTLITEINAFEVYARDIGMVYAENIFIQRFDGKTSGRKIITRLESYQ